jgi:NAD-reducing hydrogenase large subunit
VRGPSVPEGVLNRVEAAVRCYDPCFSCSTHALGRMPLEITVIGPDGTPISRTAREG